MRSLLVSADETPPGVSATSIGAAMMRAQECAEPDALFDDPYAAAFVSAAPRPFEDVPDPDGELARLEAEFRADVAIRTRFIDDYVIGASHNGIAQIVLLGAGLDSRAFRLDLVPATHVFEVDLPGVFEFKEQVLRELKAHPRCTRAVVPIDMRRDWGSALLDTGFEPRVRTAWVAEGVLGYFSESETFRLLEVITRLSASGSCLAFEQASVKDDSALAQASALPQMTSVARMWHDGGDSDVASWLREHGWRATTHDRASLAQRYGRASGATTAQFVSASLSQ